MPDTSAARAAVLGKIRRALATNSAPRDEYETPDLAWTQLPRAYRHSSTLDRDSLLHLLEDRLRDYDAGVYRCTPEQAGETVARVLAERGKRRMAIPSGLDVAWTTQASAQNAAFVDDTPGDIAILNGCEGILTGATVAIAQTGSIVLQDVPGQGRRAATLLPDYHLCVLHAGAVVETVPEALARLAPTAALATTFFSGPSATADIEMTRVKGVHGPRFVDVILLLN